MSQVASCESLQPTTQRCLLFHVATGLCRRVEWRSKRQERRIVAVPRQSLLEGRPTVLQEIQLSLASCWCRSYKPARANSTARGALCCFVAHIVIKCTRPFCERKPKSTTTVLETHKLTLPRWCRMTMVIVMRTVNVGMRLLSQTQNEVTYETKKHHEQRTPTSWAFRTFRMPLLSLILWRARREPVDADVSAQTDRHNACSRGDVSRRCITHTEETFRQSCTLHSRRHTGSQSFCWCDKYVKLSHQGQ